ncbi:hypothetical protein WN943_002846 [Citrus x changshan-huyou]
MGSRPIDIARQYCRVIDPNRPSRVSCNFCGHEMQGITRFKEHLVGKRGDVLPCKRCPDDVCKKMVKGLVQLSLKREEKERTSREALQSRMRNNAPPPPPHSSNRKRPPAAAAADLEAEERALMEKVIKESLQTFEMEKKKVAKYDDDEIEAAIRESKRSYKEEQWRRGEGCSKYARARPPSSFGDYESIDVDSDYDSDDDFSF